MVLVFIFSMSLYFPAISTESVVDQVLMQGEHTAVPRGPQGYVNLDTKTDEPDIVPISTAPVVEHTKAPIPEEEMRETKVIEPMKAKAPEATTDAVFATATPSIASANTAIPSNDSPTSTSSKTPSVLPATAAVVHPTDSDEVAKPPTPSTAVQEITSIPTTVSANPIQAATTVSSTLPAIVETPSPSPKPSPTQAQLPENVANLIWALKNKNKMPNAAEQSSTSPHVRTASPPTASELPAEAKRVNSQPANARSTKEIPSSTESSVLAATAAPTESLATNTAALETTQSIIQAEVDTTLPLTIQDPVLPTIPSTQAPATMASEEPQQTSPFGSANIFEWVPPAQLKADDPNRERKVVEWRQSVAEAVQSVRNSVIGGEQLRSLIRQRRDELLALRVQLFG